MKFVMVCHHGVLLFLVPTAATLAAEHQDEDDQEDASHDTQGKLESLLQRHEASRLSIIVAPAEESSRILFTVYPTYPCCEQPH